MKSNEYFHFYVKQKQKKVFITNVSLLEKWRGLPPASSWNAGDSCSMSEPSSHYVFQMGIAGINTVTVKHFSHMSFYQILFMTYIFSRYIFTSASNNVTFTFPKRVYNLFLF